MTCLRTVSRSTAEFRHVKLSIFARGATPSAGRSDAPGQAQVNVLMGATWVMPGDWIVADDDGAVAIPASARPVRLQHDAC
jgi:regulator of RNase E activity RraA